MKTTRDKTKNKKIWISIDESTDPSGRFVANVIVGSLNPSEEEPVKAYLLTIGRLERVNNSTICQLFINPLQLILTDEIQYNVLIFISDGVPCMKKPGQVLKLLFPNMVHVTCVAHEIHRVSEEVRSLFPDADKLNLCIEKIFLKAPSPIKDSDI